MDTKDTVMILAVIAGPILAVQAQKYIESIRESKNRKLRIFHTLMSTRATRIAQAHVAALNMIDIEFYGKTRFGKRNQSNGEKKITNAWKVYNDHLNNKASEERMNAWIDKSDELFTSLLYSMAQYLGYEFDEVQLKRDCYRPIAHGDIENEQHKLRQGLVAVLEGKKSIPMAVTYLPPYHPIDPAQSEESHIKSMQSTADAATD
jgi:cellobiose-specific phosphotransferase system component IIA